MERLEPERHVILSHTHAHLFMERLEPERHVILFVRLTHMLICSWRGLSQKDM